MRASSVQRLMVGPFDEARGSSPVEYVDKGVSGAKDRRPALDRFIANARHRRFDALCTGASIGLAGIWHLITLHEELRALGIAFLSLSEAIDVSTPAGKLQMHILAANAEFERARIAERSAPPASLGARRRLAKCIGHTITDRATEDMKGFA